MNESKLIVLSELASYKGEKFEYKIFFSEDILLTFMHLISCYNLQVLNYTYDLIF